MKNLLKRAKWVLSALIPLSLVFLGGNQLSLNKKVNGALGAMGM